MGESSSNARGIISKIMARNKRKTGASPGIPAAQLSPAVLRFAVPALIALFSLFAWSQGGLYEDGFFYLRVVDVFLHSGELAYNPGERHETNTDFLWTLLLIPGPAVGLDPVLWMHVLGVAVYAAALWATFALARKALSDAEAALVALVLLGGHYSFAHFAATGFAPHLQALAALCCLLALLRFGESPSPRNGAMLGLALFFLAVCRLDSAVLGIPLVLCAMHFARRTGKSAAPGIILALGIPSVLFGGVLLWKLSYYGDIFPATYYAKANNTHQRADMEGFFLMRGAGYAVLYWQRYFFWALAGIAAWGAWRSLKTGKTGKKADRLERMAVVRPLLWTIAAMCALWHAYMLRTGGDLTEFRFMMSQAPMLMILAAAGLRGLAREWRWAAAAGAVFFSALHWQTAPDFMHLYGPPFPGFSGRTLVSSGIGMHETALATDGGAPRVQVDIGTGLESSRLIAEALRKMFGHLGDYPPEVRVAHPAGGAAAYDSRLLWTEMRGWADSRIGLANPDELFPRAVNIGHHILARPELLARLGVNLLIGNHHTGPSPDFSRPLVQADNPRLTWAMFAAANGSVAGGTFPEDSQLFALPLSNGEFTPVVYFNRNQTIDGILDENGVERVNVF